LLKTEYRLAKSESPTEIVRRLVEIVVEHNLAELDVEHEGVKVNIKGLVATAPVAMPAPALPTPSAPPQPRPAADQKQPPHFESLEAPMVGVFYRAPHPGDPPYINVGDVVHMGQIIGVIEAMKVFSDVPAERAGRVVEIVAVDGKLVHQGDPLMHLEPL
jgi:acetyl-CoA carboxylase biotin carboxyl carrier protein